MAKRDVQIGDAVEASTYKVVTGCGPVYVTVNYTTDTLQGQDGNPDPDRVIKHPVRILGKMGKAGGCAASQIEAVTSLVSVALSHGAPLDEIAAKLGGIRCHNAVQHTHYEVRSCADAMWIAIRRFLGLGVPKRASPNGDRAPDAGSCPECEVAMIEDDEGSRSCPSCGHTE
jgi:ribonucleoside-diphosphate reductase alpha chain